MSECIRCRNHESPGDRPYCVNCTFMVRAEIEDGLRKLSVYLAKWSAFGEWEQAHAQG